MGPGTKNQALRESTSSPSAPWSCRAPEQRPGGACRREAVAEDLSGSFKLWALETLYPKL